MAVALSATPAFGEIPVNTWVNMEPDAVQPADGTTESDVRGTGPD
jgi:hypothetical protein